MDLIARRKHAHNLKRLRKRRTQYAQHRADANKGSGVDWFKAYTTRPK